MMRVRIIANINTGTHLDPVRIYDAYRLNRNVSNTINYSCLLLCKVVGESVTKPWFTRWSPETQTTTFGARTPRLGMTGRSLLAQYSVFSTLFLSTI